MDQKDIFAADVLFDLHESLPIREGADRAFAQLCSDGFSNGAGERRVGRASKNFHELVLFMGPDRAPHRIDGFVHWNARRTVTMRASAASGFL